jgi:hypothetical protein
MTRLLRYADDFACGFNDARCPRMTNDAGSFRHQAGGGEVMARSAVIPHSSTSMV